MSASKRRCTSVQRLPERNRLDELPNSIVELCYEFDGRWRRAFDDVVQHLIVLKKFTRNRRSYRTASCATDQYSACGHCSWGCTVDEGVPGTSYNLLLALLRAPLPAPAFFQGTASIDCGGPNCLLVQTNQGPFYRRHSVCCPWNPDGRRCHESLGEHDEACRHAGKFVRRSVVYKCQFQHDFLELLRRGARNHEAYTRRYQIYPEHDQAFFRVLFKKLSRAREARMGREERSATKIRDRLVRELTDVTNQIIRQENRRELDAWLTQTLPRPIGPSKAPRKKRVSRATRST